MMNKFSVLFSVSILSLLLTSCTSVLVVGRDDPGNAIMYDQIHYSLAAGSGTCDGTHSTCAPAHNGMINILALDGRVRTYKLSQTDRNNSASAQMVWGGLDDRSHDYSNP